jgi:hypothetical protein
MAAPAPGLPAAAPMAAPSPAPIRVPITAPVAVFSAAVLDGLPDCPCAH